MGRKKKPPLWERQEWDTRASFTYFYNYYLLQLPPRSLNRGYRNYRTDIGQIQDRKTEAASAWRNWFKARSYSGKKIKGAVGWARRANVFDDYCAKHNIDQWIARREQVREKDWNIGSDLRELAIKILGHSPNYIIEKQRIVKGGKGKPDKIIITLALDVNAAVKVADLASKLQRLAAGMETENLVAEFDILQQVRVVLPDNLRGDRGVNDND